MKKFLASILVVAVLVTLFSFPAMANKTEHLTGDFNDIEDHWAYEQMTELIAMGILKGYSETVWDPDMEENLEVQTVRPDQKITRAEFAVLLFQALNLDAEPEDAPFADEIPGWASEAVNSLHKSGIVGGYPDGTFKPNNNISRAEIVSMLVRALNDKSELTGKDFPDVPSGYWAYDSVQKASGMGIVNGMPDGDFKPGNGARRGEVMVMIYQFLLKDSSQVPDDDVLLSRTEEVLKIYETQIGGSESVELSSLLPYTTGEYELLVPDGQAALNELKKNGTLTYEVTYPGKVVTKSDRLAEVVFETKAAFNNDAASIERELKEHYYLMKIRGQWYIYSSMDEELL